MGSKDYIVMLPFMAYGHLTPFLELSRKLHQRYGFNIIIANTPLNIKCLRSSFSSESTFRFLELPFSSTDHGLPPNTENCENLSQEEIGKLLVASLSLKTPFLEAVSEITSKDGKPPICVISDGFLGWANDVAKSLGTVNLSFSTAGAYGTLAYISLCQNLPHLNPGFQEFQVPGFPETRRFHITQLDQFLRETDGNDLGCKFMQSLISFSFESFGWLCNTVEEIEPLGLDCLRKYVKLPIWPIGPLLSNASLSKKSGISTQICLDWLNLKNPSSVLYICFGSQNSINPSQMMELAIGLEKSEKPFIWVIRPPVGFDSKGEFKAEWLPEGFEERMVSSKQGLVVKNWAPQLDILSHKSTGAFMSHCGWNSVVESLSQGVPIIGWPLAGEQPYNAKMMVEEMGVCVEFCRGMHSNISWEEVKEVIEMVLDNKGKGEHLRNKAMEISKLIKKSVKEEGSSVKAFDDLVTTLLSNRL